MDDMNTEVRGWSLGKKIIAGSVAVALAGMVPLLLVALLGPRNANPIGLGLLMVLGWLVGFVGVIVGAIVLLVQAWRR